MDKLNLFISSTFYDFKDVRRILEGHICNLGHTPTLHESQGIFYDPNSHTHTSCLKNIEENCDIFILIIGSRFGGDATVTAFKELNLDELKDKSNFKNFFKEGKKYSITQCEYLKAVEKGVPVLTFIEKSLDDKKHLYERVSKEKKIDPHDIPFFDSDKDNSNAQYIFEFIKFITNRSENNAICYFERSDEITTYITNYLSVFFKRLLHASKLFVDEEFQLIPSKFPAERIVDYFFEDSNRQRAIHTLETHLQFDENGHCKYYNKIKIKPIDKLSYYHYQMFSDKKGNVNIEEFRVFETPYEREYFGIKRDIHLRLNLFFREQKINEEFTVIVKLHIENFLSDLVEKGTGFLHRSVTNTFKQFNQIDETIEFPDTDLFKNLKVKILSHPEDKYINRVLKPKVISGKKVFKVRFMKKDKTLFKKDTMLQFKI